MSPLDKKYLKKFYNCDKYNVRVQQDFTNVNQRKLIIFDNFNIIYLSTFYYSS